jgi:DnaJ-class molecular chaperone
MTNSPQDYYAVLGIPKTASQDDIKKAYRRLARKYHPDLHPGAKKTEMEKKFKELNEAHDVLRNEDTRKKYDQYGFQWKEAEAYHQAQQQAGREGMRTGRHTEYTQGNPQDFSDLFENLFGQKAGPQGTSFRDFAMAGADLEATAQLTLREVFTGTTRRLQIPDPAGKAHTLDVRIPKGVKDGERVRVKGKGTPGRGGGPRGDLYLRVHVAPHPVFHRTGNHLTIHLPLWPWEAALGTEVQVPTLTGPVRLKIPPGSQTKQKMRLKGKGLPNRSGSPGDQFVILNITMPDSLTEQEQNLYEQLKGIEHPDPRTHLMHEATHA